METTKTNMLWQASSFAQLYNSFYYFIYIFMLLALPCLKAEEASLPPGITVNLRNPEYSEGTLKTDDGGLITAEGIRIQAQHIRYERKIVSKTVICRIEAEGNLLFEFGEYLFIGKRLEYDFQTKTGVIFEGKTAVEPWFFGGEEIRLHADGSYTIHDSFLTTSESCVADWKLSAKDATLSPSHDLKATNFKFQYYNIPLLWIPILKVNLDYIFDSPIRYSARWGGRQGPRVELAYELFSWNNWKTFLRFDYRLTRGPGLGIETLYRSDDRKETFEAINYIARDSSVENPHEKYRYRFQGAYSNSFFNDKVTLNLTYDKLSDKYIATDYRDSSLDLEYPGVTSLQVRRQADTWIANLFSKMRLNSFQTVKQELPTLEMTWKPFNLGSTGIISNQSFKASYLKYVYADKIHRLHDYNSTRIQYQHQFYRSFRLSPFILTPELGGNFIYYGNLPKRNERWLALGIFRLEAKAPFFKEYEFYTHTLTPYGLYEYDTMPTSVPSDHFIFDINDSLYKLNIFRFGVQQTFYGKLRNGILYRPIKVDLYANAFFDTKTYSRNIPKIYAEIEFYSSQTLRHSLNTSWDFEHQMLDHFNFRSEWTLSENLALAAEYRHRDIYAFRKADPTNFILDSYRTPQRLSNSPLSDRRDTLLVHFFYRFHPLWALEFQTRHGWNRKHQPNYTEFEFDLIGKPQQAWQVKFSYQHHENDRHRFTVYFNMGLSQPDHWKYSHFLPTATF